MCIRDSIRAEHNSMAKIFNSQVIIPEVMVFEPIYIPRELNTGTCIWQVTYFILRAYTGTMC